MKYTATALASATMVAMTNAHGFITKPAARMPGTAMQDACGMQVYYNQKGDNYGNVQGELQVASSQDDYDAKACNIWMCKGYKYADNTDNVQKWTVGQSVPITVDIRAPHTGTANVSIVETATNTMVGSVLKHWDVYASTASSIPEGQKQFDITIPELNGKCTTPGACVLQWWWDAHSIDQTYESCVDFTVSGGSGSKAVVSSAVESQVAATTAAPVASSTSEAAVASTCACSPSKRDALPQQAYGSDSTCSASTSTQTVTQTATATITATITEAATQAANAVNSTTTITETSTATVTATITLSPSGSSASATGAVSAPTSANAAASGVTASTSKCTTSITLTRSPSSGVSSVVAADTGAPFPYPVANATIAPTASAPSVSLAPVLSSALANITSSVADAALTSVVPSASVNPLISSYLANITSVLPTGALPAGTAAPTALPSGYITVTSAPQPTGGAAPPPSYGGSDEAPAQGMTLKQVFEWIAYLMKQVFQDGEKKGEAEGAKPAAPAAYGKRSHARSFQG